MYKILADSETAVVLNGTTTVATFAPKNGYSAYDLAERLVATYNRRSAASDVKRLPETVGYLASPTNMYEVFLKEACNHAHQSLGTLRTMRRLLDEAIQLAEVECAVYDRTETGGRH
jgi:hypothetical protein